MAAIRVPKAVRDRVGDEATFGLLEMLESANASWSEHVLTVATERFERRLTHEISGLREEFHRSLAEVRQEIAATRFELLKWTFLFCVGQVAVVAGLLSYMLPSAGR